MKKLISLIVLIPIGIVVVALSVANRQTVSLSIPPQVGEAPLYAFNLPLYALIFATLFVGMMLGSCATWFGQGKHRKQAREQKLEATKMTFEAQKQQERADSAVETLSNEQKALSALGLPAPGKAG